MLQLDSLYEGTHSIETFTTLFQLGEEYVKQSEVQGDP
jgi:hypothetical protein